MAFQHVINIKVYWGILYFFYIKSLKPVAVFFSVYVTLYFIVLSSVDRYLGCSIPGYYKQGWW